MLEEVEKAYIAGLFDGEGCSSISHGRYKRNGRERFYWNRKVFFVITNEDRRVLREVVLLLRKGGIYFPPTKSAYNLCISKPTDIIEVAKLIYPYIRVKKSDLDNLCGASEFLLKNRGSNKRHIWTEEEEKEFHNFYKMNKALKGGKGGRPRINPLQ